MGPSPGTRPRRRATASVTLGRAGASWALVHVNEELPPRLRASNGDRVRADALLFRRLRDPADPVDREIVVDRFLPLARQLARRYQRSGEPFDDLFQVACLGLVKAVDRFDPERGIAFSSFAMPTILGELRRHFRDRTWSVRMPRDLQDLALKSDRAVADLSARLGRQPTVAEIGGAIGVDVERVLEAVEAFAAYRTVSLDAPSPGDDDGADRGDQLFGGPDDGFELAEHRATLGRLLGLLTTRERDVLRMRFEQDLTQAEIGARIGVSQMQVSRIIRQALARLQAVATAGAR